MPFKIDNQVVNKHLVHLVPHGINSKMFVPLEKSDKKVNAKHKALFGDKKISFVVFHNSRNVQRKKTSNLILAFRMFCDSLSPEEASECALVMHTEKYQDAGTDLPAVIAALCPKYTVIIDESKILPEDMAAMYNVADVTILTSSNEGFGLSIAESIMCGIPVVVNVTGGLQDQIGQMDDQGNPVKFDKAFSTNNGGKYKKHGVWAKPVWPASRSIQGSIPTPYIFDDVCTWEDTAKAIMYWYLMSPDDRRRCGLKGREWALNEGGLNSENMCNQFIKAMDFTLNHFVPKAPFSIHSTNECDGHKQPDDVHIGIDIPVIDKNVIAKEVNETISRL
jgi:glycosyltransferase involved in cell wall biosynthesis